VDLKIEPGEFVAIMGSSGSGKSTLMNMLGCLDKPSSGRYLLEGADVSRMEKRELAALRNRKLGFVFQGFNLLARTTALENVELPTLYARMEKAERTARARQVLEMVGLGERIDHFPSQLSGGQQQRVAIARALVNRPAILLADEPTGNLDSRTSVEIMQIFQDLNDSGLTIVLVTHETDIAQYAKRIVVFRDGKILRVKSIQVRAVDATGSGDAFNGGFLHGYLAGWPLEDCLRAGNICGALAATQAGGSSAIPTHKKLLKLMKKLQ
jgi:putative ABC transport system ATP-binding protein